MLRGRDATIHLSAFINNVYNTTNVPCPPRERGTVASQVHTAKVCGCANPPCENGMYSLTSGFSEGTSRRPLCQTVKNIRIRQTVPIGAIISFLRKGGMKEHSGEHGRVIVPGTLSGPDAHPRAEALKESRAASARLEPD